MSALLYLVIGFLLFLTVGAALGFAGLNRRGELGRRLAAMEMRVDALVRRLDALDGGAPVAEAPAVPEPSPVITPKPEAEVIPAQPTPQPQETPPISAAAGSGIGGIEVSLTSRWLVWIGALALALAGAFLVKYSIDREWLTPTIRCAQGFVLGLVLIGVGEYLRRRPADRDIAGIKHDYVPPALTAAGLFSVFASIYAAYVLYGLIGPVPAFALMAATAFGGFALAFVQGPLIAILGLLGSFLTPLIIAPDQPSSWSLFPYLLAVTIAALAVVRFMRWWWLALGSLAGSLLWAWSWYSRVWMPGDETPVGLFIVAIGALYLFIRPPRDAADPLYESPGGQVSLAMPEIVAWSGGLAAAVLGYAMVRMAGYNDASLFLVGLLMVVFLIAGYRDLLLDGFAVIAAALAVALMATWHLPQIITESSFFYLVEGRRFGGPPNPIIIPEILQFAAISVVLGVMFGIAGFVSAWRAARPVIWVGISAATPGLLFAIAYWRLTDFAIDLKWAMMALGLALVMLSATTTMQARWTRESRDTLVGIYAAATVSALGLGTGMLLKQAWLTVALAAQLPALAWIQGRLKIETLRPVAAVVAIVVLVRLAFNPYVLDYPLGEVAGFNWILYGYGLPALLFFEAARRFRSTRADWLVHLLEAGSILFAVLLVSFEIRNIVTGPLGTPHYGLVEQGLQSIAWLTIALLLVSRYRGSASIVALYAARALILLAASQVVFLQALGGNPLWSSTAIYGPPFANALLIAYAAPALFAFVLAGERYRDVLPGLSNALNAGGLLLVLLYLSLAVRQIFQGPELSYSGFLDAELYTYSAVWIAFAAILLAMGYVTGKPGLRYASLALILISTGKVFLVDMSGLTGLYRVLSFLGLGLALVGIGYFYQRFVFPRTPPSPSDGNEGQLSTAPAES